MNDEIFPIVDPQGNVIGSATRKECHSGSMLLHPVVHLHIIDEKGRVFLQLRSRSKDIQPGRWDTAVGGHVDFGEKIEDALKREVHEELGVDVVNVTKIKTYVFKSSRERELVNVYAMKVDSVGFSPTFDPGEIDDVRFWTDQEILESTGRNLLTPNFESEYNEIRLQLRALL